MLKLTFHRKIALSILLTALFISVLYTSINLVREQSVMREAIIREKTELSNFLAITVEVAEARAGLAYKYKLIERIGEYEGVLYVRIVKPSGEIYLSTERSDMGRFIIDPAIRTNETIVKDDVYKGRNIKVAVSPSSGGHTVWLGFSLEKLQHNLHEAILINLLLLLPVLAVIFVASFLLSKSMIEPVKTLIRGVESIGEGNLDHHIEARGEDEIGSLAKAFNKMTEDLKKSRAEIEEYNRGLEEKVRERTLELQSRVDELEKFHKLTVGRELKMIELKKRIAELEDELKK